MKLAAALIHARPAGCLSVAGLSLLERLMVTAHRAGCHPIRVLGSAPLPRFRRLKALGIAWERGELSEPLADASFVADSNVLLTVADVRCLLETRAALVNATGTSLPAGVLEAGAPPAEARFAGRPAKPGSPVCAVVSDEATRRSAEKALWASLTSSSDGWVDRHVNRPLGRLLSKVLIHTAVSPNQVSVVSILIGIASGLLFARGVPGGMVIAAWLLQLSAVIDCVDGDLARVLFKQSRLGRWLDLVGDQFVHLAVLGGIPLGLYRQGLPAPWLALGISCVVGVLLSFAVVVRGLSRARTERSPRLERFIDATTNRDFSVLLIVLAPLGALEWFVWAAAIGIHLFWMTALGLQLHATSQGARPNRGPS